MPIWLQLVVDAFVFGILPFVIGFIVHLAHVRGQSLPDRRIEATERLALQAAKSIAPMNSVEGRKDAADVAFLVLCKEYGVHIPGKQAREHVLNAAFFDIGG